MFLRAIAFVTISAVLLQGCTIPGLNREVASDAEIAAAFYRDPGPAKLTLYTMVNNASGAGAHTSLMINASQRVIFDPAGTLRMRAIPEKGDVIYGVTPVVEDFYARAHARNTFHVMIQEIEVTPEIAEMALRLVQSNGPVGQARCAASTSQILRKLPGFESISGTWFPVNLADQFGALPGATTTRLFENDDDDKTLAVKAFENRLAAEAAQAQ